jgi:hypothetical protein
MSSSLIQRVVDDIIQGKNVLWYFTPQSFAAYEIVRARLANTFDARQFDTTTVGESQVTLSTVDPDGKKYFRNTWNKMFEPNIIVCPEQPLRDLEDVCATLVLHKRCNMDNLMHLYQYPGDTLPGKIEEFVESSVGNLFPSF